MKKALSLLLALTLVLAFAAPAFAADQTYTREQVEDMYWNIAPFSLPKIIDACKGLTDFDFTDFCAKNNIAVMLEIISKKEHDNIPNYVKELDDLLAKGLMPTNVPIFAMFFVPALGDPEIGYDEVPDDEGLIFWNNGNQVALPNSAYGWEEMLIATQYGVVARFEDLPNYEKHIGDGAMGTVSTDVEALFEELQLDEHDYVLHPELRNGENTAQESLSTDVDTGSNDTPTIVGGFSDVHEEDYFADAVLWAVNHEPKITEGMGEGVFGAQSAVTRAQAVTFLWRAADKPEPASTDSSFVDVADPNAYYYKAVLWAKEQGITYGNGANTFGVDDTLTYDQMLTFIARAYGADTSGDWSAKATAWAAENGLTDGLTYAVKDDCPRADVVYFLWKEMR